MLTILIGLTDSLTGFSIILNNYTGYIQQGLYEAYTESLRKRVLYHENGRFDDSTEVGFTGTDLVYAVGTF